MHSLSLLFFTLSLTTAQLHDSSPPLDALSLLIFKSKADRNNKLNFTFHTRSNFCQWQGVKCLQNRIIRFVIQNTNLRGTLAPNSLNQLDQLRVLSLRNNSMFGPIPDFSGLVNLKTLFLDRNSFSGSLTLSVFFLKTLLFLDLSHNNLTGSIPAQITSLDLLTYLRLEFNNFTGPFPPLNQTYLKIFNASNNNFSGAIPVTAPLSRFGVSSFYNNMNLCGVIIHVECSSKSTPPFFGSSGSVVTATSPPLPALQRSPLSPPFLHKHKRVGIVLGIVLGALIVAAAFLCVITFCKSLKPKPKPEPRVFETEQVVTRTSDAEVVETKNKKTENKKNDNKLVFCEDEGRNYTLEQLMRASAELLGRGTIGTTYKAVMDGRVTVSVKRLDAGKTAITDNTMFEGHMELVGGLRHPNLVPVRAYFQAKEERLIVYDYQPNGSLFNLIHGSRSTRAKPLHWTSCLKIADDVAQGLAYIHQASQLVHGNLKSTNVLVGADFEACLTDYCLSTLTDHSSITLDLDSERYRAPEIRSSTCVPTTKSDVYAFGVLLLELVTGKLTSQHPYLDPMDMNDWVRAMRDDDVEEDYRLGMLVEVVSICSLKSPEQRPSTRQVLKMIQDIKERVVVEDDNRNGYCAY